MTLLSPLIRQFKKLKPWERGALFTLFILGFGLRLRQYLAGRSLWADEAMLALNIVQRDFMDLLLPLDYNQGAPLGFLLVVKASVVALANHELVLRLIPFAAGVFSLLLYGLLLRQVTGGVGLLVAFALFAVSPKLVYYSSEVKQYILDVTAAVAVLLLAVWVHQNREKKKGITWLGLAGSAALWFSHPAVFVLASVWTSLFVSALVRRDRLGLTSALKLGLAWGANLALLYILSWDSLSRNAYLQQYWDEYYLPLSLSGQAAWFSSVLLDWTQVQVGLSAPAWLVAVLLLAGSVGLARQSSVFAGAVLGTFVLALAASGLKLYPLAGRLSLFLVPLILVILGKAVERLEGLYPDRKYLGPVTALSISIVLLYGPVVTSVENFMAPKYFEHIRPSMDYLASKWREGDGMYVTPGAVPAFRYYAPHYKLDDAPYEAGREEDYANPQLLLGGVEPLLGKHRVWVLMTHIYEKGDFNEKDFLLAYLDAVGERELEFREPDTSVFLYLYDLTP